MDAQNPSPNPAEPTAPRGAFAGYQVIARRYRPRLFHEVVGQEGAAETLKQAILKERLAHAYLFCGPRGVGKTSMARIFASALKCPQAQEADPCGECETCRHIATGEDMDVVEMDGASHRGIDDIRDLIQHVKFRPTAGRYRIFIIDEVHMLTREAFNALLKTLEEPPAHVKFVFATTEPEKVLPTVISRCQRLDFAAISPADIVKRLKQICEQESATPEEGLLMRIAELSRGGMRDSQSLLDQLLSFSGLEPTLADLDRITGRLAPKEIAALVQTVMAGNRSSVVSELEKCLGSGTDAAVLTEQLLETLRNELHEGLSAGWSEEAVERQLIAAEILQEARLRMRLLTQADLILELALLRIASLSEAFDLGQVDDGVVVAAQKKNDRQNRGRVKSETVEASGPTRPSEPAQSEPAPSELDPQAQPGPSEPENYEGVDTYPTVAAEKPATGKLESSLVSDCLEAISPTLARVARIELGEGDRLAVAVPRAVEQIVGAEWPNRLKRQLREKLGRAIPVDVDLVEEATQSDEASTDREPPPIVDRAVEIFRGKLLGDS